LVSNVILLLIVKFENLKISLLWPSILSKYNCGCIVEPLVGMNSNKYSLTSSHLFTQQSIVNAVEVKLKSEVDGTVIYPSVLPPVENIIPEPNLINSGVVDILTLALTVNVFGVLVVLVAPPPIPPPKRVGDPVLLFAPLPPPPA
jgi:hypothetical protein